jgi:hypothetical protein
MMNQNTINIKSRERVSRTLRHESPDRPPLDLGSTPNTSITKIAYDNWEEMADMFWGRCTTFRPMFHRKTSWRSMMQRSSVMSHRYVRKGSIIQ